ncbi:uncharacterized protein LOC143377123 [Andrena cerasifolii]|uniref:uncharacterized protein LOC143377123 n=1 Tax=Andrena cerasifolii TaxID=2819439 RepID=UPI004037D279
MPYNNSRGQDSNFVKEKHVLESEVSCEDHVVKRSQSGRKIVETNLSLRKCRSVDEPLKRSKRRRIRRLRTQNFKMNFLQVKMQKNKSGATKKSDCNAAVPSPIDFDSHTL